ncbi:PPOX class F420-dependent oxidoreductase [Streptomyces sp. NBC_01239]|uniref:PPOX class F420-dependent oxidoreductase n=1 Tax=Streptomyces sp. NBC_01239 TaxID=2903792 RepID=UPI002258B011|nr:PPOX class F420-dependent oxidoreductase [Streptomyces sp. NBC_01239]MCX4815743.1 PPOX class F420-dependent oxidoreductase [Streptomyces sp. NBC_01239]
MTTPRSDFDQALDRIGRGSHVSLTTFRRNGLGVPTPVGSLVHDGTLYALTPPDTGKAKRIRNNPQVTIAPCDMKGTVPDGVAVVPATARLLDPAETARVEELMRRRFFMYRVVHLLDRALRRERPLVAIAVRA